VDVHLPVTQQNVELAEGTGATVGITRTVSTEQKTQLVQALARLALHIMGAESQAGLLADAHKAPAGLISSALSVVVVGAEGHNNLEAVQVQAYTTASARSVT
jgi:hypothetical protein